jgi:P-type Cu+ transporter
MSTVDQSSITGESIPVEKSVNDTVYAGTINLSHQLEVKCDKLSTDTTFAKIIHLVEEAEASKAPIQKLSDKLATRLIQFAIGLSILTFIVTQNIVSALSVIVVAGACGLAVGTPIALLAANSKLAKRGIIVKGGLQIENLKHTGTIVFDKTGTLTMGNPAVSQVIAFEPNIEPKYVLECAAIAEKNINHPLAKAIERKAIEEKIQVKTTNGNFMKIGRGATIMHNGIRISVGNLRFMEEELSKTTTSLDEEKNNYYYSITSNSKFTLSFNNKNKKSYYRYLINGDDDNSNQNTNGTMISQFDKSNNYNNYDDDTILFASSNTTAVFVSLDKRIIGAVLLEDKLRVEAIETISKIKAMGIRVIMLTGDNDKIAKRIADKVDIDEYHANLLPQDKVSKIEEILLKQNETKKTVIMVGDGINDAPALAKAHVGIAMGRTGTDIAIETADVVLMTEDLTKILYLLRKSRQALCTIQENFFGTLFIDGLGFILAFVGILNPLSAAIIHVSSELIFMINSARFLIHTKDQT